LGLFVWLWSMCLGLGITAAEGRFARLDLTEWDRYRLMSGSDVWARMKLHDDGLSDNVHANNAEN
jgi:hypothetical protein